MFSPCSAGEQEINELAVPQELEKHHTEADGDKYEGGQRVEPVEDDGSKVEQD